MPEVVEVPPAAMKAARSVARRVQYSARGLIEYEDLVSIGYEWLVKHPDKVEDWCEGGGVGWRMLRTSLQRAMGRAVARERKRRIGEGAQDQTYYSPGMVEELLPHVWDLHARTAAPVTDGERRGRQSPSEGGNHMTALADVTHAISRMPADAASMLHARYVEGLTYDEIGGMFGVTGQVAARRLDRYLHTIVDLLGGERPWPRRSRSRAAARATTDNDYEGDGHD